MIIKTIFVGIVTVIAASFVSPMIEEGSQLNSIVKEATGTANNSNVGVYELGGGRSVNQMLTTRNTTFNY